MPQPTINLRIFPQTGKQIKYIYTEFMLHLMENSYISWMLNHGLHYREKMLLETSFVSSTFIINDTFYTK